MNSPRDAFDQARRTWIARLIDTSRRNNLLYFRDLKTGTLDLERCDREALGALFDGNDVSIRELFPDADVTAEASKLREIGRRALSNAEEKGLQTLFMALGMATWSAADGGRPAESAVLLLPLTVKSKATEGSHVSLSRSGDPQVNAALFHVLRSEHGCEVDGDAISASVPDNLRERDELFATFARLAADIDGFAIADRIVIGNFAFQKMAMVRDLQEFEHDLRQHDLIAALAGDADARARVEAANETQVEAEELDRTDPDAEFLVVDADSSQQRVIASVLAGSSGVIQGPPGCGKSQTIVNLIASLTARGQRTLFVAEKRAALEVVVERLEREGLGHLVADLHGADVSQRQIMDKIRQTLEVIRSIGLPDAGRLHSDLVQRRRELNEHVARMHMKRTPSGLSIFELQSRLVRLRPDRRSHTRWHGAGLKRLGEAAMAKLDDAFRQLQTFADLLDLTTKSPWLGARISNGAEAQATIATIGMVLGQQLPRYEESLADLSRDVGAQLPKTIGSADKLLNLCHDTNRLLDSYDVKLVDENLEQLSTDISPGASGPLLRAIAWITNKAYRAGAHQLRKLRHKPADLKTIASELIEAIRTRDQWGEATGTQLHATHALESAARQARNALFTSLDDVAQRVDLKHGPQQSLAEVRAHLELLHDDTVTPFRIPQFGAVQHQIEEGGGADLLREIRLSRAAPETWLDLLQHAWLASCLDDARASDPAIASFDGRLHDRVADEFRKLDHDRTIVAIDRLKRAHAKHAIEVMNAHPDQAALIRREAEKKTRHVPLRKLIADAPDVLLALCPCWMASPLSVSQLIPARGRYFDYVLVDEASQVLPEDAVPAMLRGDRVVVAGDRHQLPPTTFFADGGANGALDDDEGDPSAVEGFESILDSLSAFLPAWLLEWHYRSRDERLIAFSNRHVYSDRLTTFPGIGGDRTIQHELVDSVLRDGEEDSSSPEVQRVVDLILQHAEDRTEESLGVITMGIKHARRVQAALDAALQGSSHLEEFFATDRRERFFIKNLERVQGDERDAIILSIGYGKDRAGNLPYRFGPLLYEGGERRLNVAVTRARNRLTLVSSFSAMDMDPSRSNAKGVELLRLYLEYAVTGGKILGENRAAVVPLNSFEEDIFKTLSDNGIPLEPQWGASQYRIDLAAKHPTRPGRFVLAVECDGATYHSAPTARDRDRLRQQQLEALGWRFHRIWSTDWFQRKESEIRRAVAAYQRAVEAADRHGADYVGDADHRQSPTSPQPRIAIRKLPKPLLPVLRDITAYSDAQLDSVIRFVQSDGLLRSDDEIIILAAKELPFHRVKSRIRERLQSAIHRTRSSWPSAG